MELAVRTQPAANGTRWQESIDSRGVPPGRCRRHWRAVWLLPVVLVCAACAGGTPPRSVVPTNSPLNTSATQTVQAEENGLVSVHVRVLQQQGRLATGHAVLFVQIVVTNHTRKPIWLYVQCPIPAILVSLTLQSSPVQMRKLIPPGVDCMLPDTSVFSQNSGPGIAPGAMSGAVQQLSLFNFYAQWSPGRYTLTATVEAWHQGTIDQDQAPSSTFLFGSSQGETVLTLS
jgi:hypothetical protein